MSVFVCMLLWVFFCHFLLQNFLAIGRSVFLTQLNCFSLIEIYILSQTFFFWGLFCSPRTLTFLTTFQQNFLNNFQTAQEALNAVTVQAAEMAASSMKDFAKKSFRLLMDINLKAPVIVVPESSTSCNALIADLGLIRVQNEFKFVSSDESSLPPVIDNMDVQLTHLKLSRYT